jgi:Ca2+-binding RTX toxin-like protein
MKALEKVVTHMLTVDDKQNSFRLTFPTGDHEQATVSYSGADQDQPPPSNFVVSLVEGATYNIFATNSLVELLDSNGNLVELGEPVFFGDASSIPEFIAPYKGDYYINTDWAQKNATSEPYLLVTENTETAVTDHSELVQVTKDNVSSWQASTAYSGPVSYIKHQYIGSASGEAVIGTAGNDFINVLGADDAVQGGNGDDVLDGGTGSNFLTGNAGSDVFFLDGRSGQTTWSTVTDWQAGEQLSLWGWQPGVSHATWAESAGTAGYEGATMHCDLDGNGSIDASVTWSGMMPGALPAAIESDGLLWIK